MIPLEPGRVVRVIAGHDADGFFAVVAAEGRFVLLADGRRRKIDRPKRKNIRHIQKTRLRLENSCLSTDSKLRNALRACLDHEGGNTIGERR